MPQPFPSVLVITNPEQVAQFDHLQAYRLLEERLGPGGFCIQLRAPGFRYEPLRRFGRTLRKNLPKVPLLVNDRVDLALELEAEGVHLGSQSMSPHQARKLLGPVPWISASAHSEAELEQRIADGVDRVLLSTVFASPGKGEPLGIAAFSQLARRFPGKVMALGGVDLTTLGRCAEAGCAGVAMVRQALNLGELKRFADALADLQKRQLFG